MDTPEKPKRRWPKAAVVVACLVIPPPAYVAGAGPVIYGIGRGYLPRAVLGIYGPARAVMNASPWRREWIDYWSWWDDAATEAMRREGEMSYSHGWEYDYLLRERPGPISN